MADSIEVSEHLINTIRLYHAAVVQSKQCPDLVNENKGHEASERMNTLYDLEDQLFVLADTFEGEIETKIRDYRKAKQTLLDHPNIYSSQSNGNREEIVQLFNELYDIQSELFGMVGIKYHETKVVE